MNDFFIVDGIKMLKYLCLIKTGVKNGGKGMKSGDLRPIVGCVKGK